MNSVHPSYSNLAYLTTLTSEFGSLGWGFLVVEEHYSARRSLPRLPARRHATDPWCGVAAPGDRAAGVGSYRCACERPVACGDRAVYDADLGVWDWAG